MSELYFGTSRSLFTQFKELYFIKLKHVGHKYYWENFLLQCCCHVLFRYSSVLIFSMSPSIADNSCCRFIKLVLAFRSGYCSATANRFIMAFVHILFCGFLFANRFCVYRLCSACVTLSSVLRSCTA